MNWDLNPLVHKALQKIMHFQWNSQKLQFELFVIFLR
jgi:hypothetical protein